MASDRLGKLQLKRSSVLDGGKAKEPTPDMMYFGELALNYNADDPVIFIKTHDGTIIRLVEPGSDGAKGEAGEAGPKGSKGNEGEVGEKGARGLEGPTGDPGPQGNQGIQGGPGPQGLQGAPGQKGAAGPKGNRGATGQAGTDGNPGPRGFKGNVGPKGAAGKDGQKGAAGETGLQGQKGPKGRAGDKGNVTIIGEIIDIIDISGPPSNPCNENGNVVIDGDGNAWLCFNGSWENIGTITGPPGAKGEEGPQGDKGIRGEQGLKGEAGIGGTKGDVGPQGDKGDDGERGLKGAKGEQGPKGPLGNQGDPGLKGNQGVGLKGNIGEPGPAGDPGSVGEKGNKGRAGDKGLKGLQGTEGLKGIAGPAGPQGEKGNRGAGDKGVAGPQGEKGIKGTFGAKGAKGNAGKDAVIGDIDGAIKGSGPPTTDCTTDGEILVDENGHAWRCTGGTWMDLGKIAGPKGAPGEIGLTGEKGNRGNVGPKGATGEPGSPGTKGDGSTVAGPKGDPGKGGAPGPQGQKGEAGDQGIQGPKGLDGVKGDPGTIGDPGPKGGVGIKGDPGPQGPIGPKGNTGEKGNAIKGNKGKPGGDSTIEGPPGPKGERGEAFEFEDFTPEQLEDLKGPAGPAGEKGEQGIEGPKGEAGAPGDLAKGQYFGHIEYVKGGADDEYRDSYLFKDNADDPGRTIRRVYFYNNQLRVELANFTASISASGESNLWDVPADDFSVTVVNPADYPNQYVASASAIINAVGMHPTIANYSTSGPSVAPGGGVTWTQTFSQNGAAQILSNGSGLSGGSARGDIQFLDDDGDIYEDTASVSFSWSSASSFVDVRSLYGSTFLETYGQVFYTVSVSGISDSSNVVNSLSAVGGTLSDPNDSGVFVFTNPLHKDDFSGRSVTLSSVFSRPASVTGTAYTANDGNTSAVNASFSYPSWIIFTVDRLTPPVVSDVIAGTGFTADVQVRGSENRRVNEVFTNNSGSPQALWFAVRSSAQQPSTFKVGENANLIFDVEYTTETIDLAPDSPPAGYTAEQYTLYGITLQTGNTYVSIN